MRSCSGSTSSSQAMTATARNSSPLARCIVLIATRPLVTSIWSVNSTTEAPLAVTAARASQLRLRTDKHADFLSPVALTEAGGDPFGYHSLLCTGVGAGLDQRWRPVEDGDDRAAALSVAIDIADGLREQCPARLGAQRRRWS